LDEKISLSRHFGGIFGGKTLTARPLGRIPTLCRDYCRDLQCWPFGITKSRQPTGIFFEKPAAKPIGAPRIGGTEEQMLFVIDAYIQGFRKV
jgi:hypothetical protein